MLMKNDTKVRSTMLEGRQKADPNKKYYNVKGIQINDPSINEGDVMTEGNNPPMSSQTTHILTTCSSCDLASKQVRTSLWLE